MRTLIKLRFGISTMLTALLLFTPIITQAADDEDFAALRAQMLALSERLDRLEAENRELSATNAELVKGSQETAVTVAAVSEKTDAVAAEVEEQAAKSSWTDTIRWKGDFLSL